MKLWDLMANADATSNNLDSVQINPVAICSDSSLPTEFQPLCQSKEFGTSFTKLGK